MGATHGQAAEPLVMARPSQGGEAAQRKRANRESVEREEVHELKRGGRGSLWMKKGAEGSEPEGGLRKNWWGSQFGPSFTVCPLCEWTAKVGDRVDSREESGQAVCAPNGAVLSFQEA